MDAEDSIRRKTVATAASKEAKWLADQSRLNENGDGVAQLSWDDIQIDMPVGKGGFSNVYKIQITGGGDQFYALKCLCPTTMRKTKEFRTGAVDLAVESEILSRLSASGGNEHVIGCHGVSQGGVFNSFLQDERGYFLVLDLLSDTLESRLDKYRSQHRGNIMLLKMRSSMSSMLERMQTIALGVAMGMQYLHANNVALRDLKPANVGFDTAGVPKIFDLGFAREVHTIDPQEVAGSLRYMAPEVVLGKGTSLSSDVYSYGVLLWELCTLEKPFSNVTSRDEFVQHVAIGGWRHTTSTIPSNDLRRIIKKCWQPKADDRPNFPRIVKGLRVELAAHMGARAEVGGAMMAAGVPAEVVSAATTSNSSSSGGGMKKSPSCLATATMTSSGNSSNNLRKINSWSAKKFTAAGALKSGLSWSKISRASGKNLANPAELLQQQSRSSTANAKFEKRSSAPPITMTGRSGMSMSRSENVLNKRMALGLGPSSSGGGSNGKNATFDLAGKPKRTSGSKNMFLKQLGMLEEEVNQAPSSPAAPKKNPLLGKHGLVRVS
jgi:serine/threonine protein kinase